MTDDLSDSTFDPDETDFMLATLADVPAAVGELLHARLGACHVECSSQIVGLTRVYVACVTRPTDGTDREQPHAHEFAQVLLPTPGADEQAYGPALAMLALLESIGVGVDAVHAIDGRRRQLPEYMSLKGLLETEDAPHGDTTGQEQG